MNNAKENAVIKEAPIKFSHEKGYLRVGDIICLHFEERVYEDIVNAGMYEDNKGLDNEGEEGAQKPSSGVHDTLKIRIV